MSDLVGAAGTPVELAQRLVALGYADAGHGCWSRAGATPRHWTELVGLPAPATPTPTVVHRRDPHGFAASLTGTLAISAAMAGIAAGSGHLDMVPEPVRPYVGLVFVVLGAALAAVKGLQLRGGGGGDNTDDGAQPPNN